MNHIKRLSALRHECRVALSKIPPENLSAFDQRAIKALMTIENELYDISRELAIILPELEQAGQDI